MKTRQISGTAYRLPDRLSPFQESLYVHLIRWKWEHITREVGYHKHKGKRIPYDAILPDRMVDELPVIYPAIRAELRRHHQSNPLRWHTFFNHMASSQAANVNLFLPILLHPAADTILRRLKPDFATLATDQLGRGYCLEFWGGNFSPAAAGSGPLADKSAKAGTDSDIAIAYRNHQGQLCLWLIEHKLAESEFTTCGGFRSKGRKGRHDCTRSFAEIVTNKAVCYHHDALARRYWDITGRHLDVFPNHAAHSQCPFQGGMNQLWRNLLLALALEDEGRPWQHASFTVVRHPANDALGATLTRFQELTANNPRFSVFTSDDVLRAAEEFGKPSLADWVCWYRNLYML